MRLGTYTRCTQFSLLAGCLLFTACHTEKIDTGLPAIEFSKVPAADLGGPEKMSPIGGRVTGARPGQQIVLYALSDDDWWIQPYSDKIFTKIQSDSTFQNTTHLGSQYAALLVDPGFIPPPMTEKLPSVGDHVSAVAIVKGTGPPLPVIKPVVIHFSGYDWIVRQRPSDRGGTRNWFNPANVTVDAQGALHLRITKDQTQNHWVCAELGLSRSLGYGSYVFTVRDTSHLEPAAALTLYTWDNTVPDEARREMDVEISRWGYPAIKNAQYVVQPYYIPANVSRFNVPAGTLTHSFRWEPGKVTFKTVRGAGVKTGSRVVDQHIFTLGVPVPGSESVQMNLYAFGKGETQLQKETEVVIEKFEYFP